MLELVVDEPKPLPCPACPCWPTITDRLSELISYIHDSSLRDFDKPLGNRSILIWGFLKDDILACVET
jgi:hypothetical protein